MVCSLSQLIVLELPTQPNTARHFLPGLGREEKKEEKGEKEQKEDKKCAMRQDV